jgi:hypothetical protein
MRAVLRTFGVRCYRPVTIALRLRVEFSGVVYERRLPRDPGWHLIGELASAPFLRADWKVTGRPTGTSLYGRESGSQR